MTFFAVAETYAQVHGLEFEPKARLHRAASFGGGTESCACVITGSISGTQHGRLYLFANGRGIGPPAAQFEIPGLGEAIEGLWVRRSGRNFMTRIKVPRGYGELDVADEAFAAKYRTAIATPTAETSARRLLDPDFTDWYVRFGPQGGVLSQAGSFEISGGVLFVRGAQTCFGSAEELDTFSNAVTGLAGRVAALVDPA